MGEDYALNFAQGGNGDSIEDVVTVFEQDLSDAHQSRVELILLQHLCQFGRGGEEDLVFEPASERNCVQVAHGTNSKRGERLLEVTLTLEINRPMLAFNALVGFLCRFGRGHAQLFGTVIAHGVQSWRNCSSASPDCLRILRKVPVGTSPGCIATYVWRPSGWRKTMWEPDWRFTMNPARWSLARNFTRCVGQTLTMRLLLRRPEANQINGCSSRTLNSLAMRS